MMTAFLINSFLVSVRLLPLLVVAPILFFVRIPMPIRLILALALAAVVASALPNEVVPHISIAILGGELLLGAILAFGFHAAYAGVDLVGRLIDTQIGFNAAGVFDPSTSNVTGLIAELLTLTLAVLFVVLDFHHALLRAFSQLLTLLPPGSLSLGLLSASLASVMTQQFLLAFMLVVPVTLALWLTDVGFAFMSRSMPQANIYFLALPVKLAIGMLMLLISLPLIIQRIPLLFENALGFHALTGGGV
jgi:flagellar biosynthetic protein FliR